MLIYESTCVVDFIVDNDVKVLGSEGLVGALDRILVGRCQTNLLRLVLGNLGVGEFLAFRHDGQGVGV